MPPSQEQPVTTTNTNSKPMNRIECPVNSPRLAVRTKPLSTATSQER